MRRVPGYGVLRFPFRAGDRILTGHAEYASNWIALKQVADRTRRDDRVVRDDETGRSSVAALERLIDDRSNSSRSSRADAERLVNPAARGRPCHARRGVPLLPRRLPISRPTPLDVDEIGCDSSRRAASSCAVRAEQVSLRAARADRTARATVPRHACADWQSDGSYRIRGDARRFGTGRPFYAGKIGLGVAVDYALAIGVGMRGPASRLLPHVCEAELTEIRR